MPKWDVPVTLTVHAETENEAWTQVNDLLENGTDLSVQWTIDEPLPVKERNTDA